MPIPSTRRRAPHASARRALLAAGLLAACGAEGPATPSQPFPGPLRIQPAPLRAFVGVHVVDVAAGRVIRDRTVVVRDGVVETVGARDSVVVPGGAAVVDGRGAWLLPGLLDMHVHLRPSELEDYVRSGITTVRSMWGWPGLATLVAEIEQGDRIGPRVRSLSPGIDAPPAYWPYTRLLTDPARAGALVDSLAALGYREVKIYEDLSPEVYDAVVDAARKRGLTWAGHRPSRVPLFDVLAAGQRSIEHLGGYAGLVGASLDEAVERSVSAGTWNCPTLAVQRVLQGTTPAAARRQAVVAALHRAGARLLVGTDSGIDATRPGLSLVDEMLEFQAAGLPNAEIVRIATVEAARYLGLDETLGTVAPGRRADLVLVSGNPLRDLEALRRPLGVHLGSGWIDMREE